jgi:hypothetical protein
MFACGKDTYCALLMLLSIAVDNWRRVGAKHAKELG